MESALLLTVLFASFISLGLLRRWARPTLPLPPGPQGYPIIGNMLAMPFVTPWKVFREWSNVYGDIMSLSLPGQTIVVLGSAKSALDLLEKRSDIYSDRPISVIHKLMSWEWNFGLMPYGETWREHRREFHQFFHQRKIPQYQPIQLQQTRAFLRRALDSPNDVGQHVRQIYAGTVLKIIYDKDIVDMTDEYVICAQEAMRGLSETSILGAYWMDYFPILKYIPGWVPGALGRKLVEYYKPFIREMRDKPYDEFQQKENGSVAASVTSEVIERLRQRSGNSELSLADDVLARNVTGIAYGAGADTTTAASQAFLIAMSLYPDAQRKAQEEIDRVVGPDRLPEFEDFENLNYTRAIVLEAIRWMVVLPLGAYHRVTQDDEYRGFRIPKGATVFANIWSILHNPDDYPEPAVFRPERFIKDGKLDLSIQDPSTFVFGFGRRVCPGRHLANASLLIAFASILRVFDVKPIISEDGKTFDPHSMVSAGFVSSPEYVPCSLSPRSKDTQRLINRTCA